MKNSKLLLFPLFLLLVISCSKDADFETENDCTSQSLTRSDIDNSIEGMDARYVEKATFLERGYVTCNGRRYYHEVWRVRCKNGGKQICQSGVFDYDYGAVPADFDYNDFIPVYPGSLLN